MDDYRLSPVRDQWGGRLNMGHRIMSAFQTLCVALLQRQWLTEISHGGSLSPLSVNGSSVDRRRRSLGGGDAGACALSPFEQMRGRAR
jgi:hypothetical protein